MRYLKSLGTVAGGPVGAIGFCMGGSLCLQTTIRNPNLAAAAVFYGGGPVPEGLPRIRSSIFGAYGIEDQGIPLERIQELEHSLQDHGVDHEIRVYEGDGHSFFNQVLPGYYREAAAREAWGHVLAFFARTLAGSRSRAVERQQEG
ncbi:MAG: hypothetical protein EXR55_02455 [Dehalococcoidia bacterium]|nr:hypothetical protein [Dehalococcoidia bacterium]